MYFFRQKKKQVTNFCHLSFRKRFLSADWHVKLKTELMVFRKSIHAALAPSASLLKCWLINNHYYYNSLGFGCIPARLDFRNRYFELFPPHWMVNLRSDLCFSSYHVCRCFNNWNILKYACHSAKIADN